MEKEVHIRQREAVPATGSTLQLMPTGNSNSEVYEIDYFCLTGEVDESAKNWIRLYSSVMPEGHTGEDQIDNFYCYAIGSFLKQDVGTSVVFVGVSVFVPVGVCISD